MQMGCSEWSVLHCGEEKKPIEIRGAQLTLCDHPMNSTKPPSSPHYTDLPLATTIILVQKQDFIILKTTTIELSNLKLKWRSGYLWFSYEIAEVFS